MIKPSFNVSAAVSGSRSIELLHLQLFANLMALTQYRYVCETEKNFTVLGFYVRLVTVEYYSSMVKYCYSITVRYNYDVEVGGRNQQGEGRVHIKNQLKLKLSPNFSTSTCKLTNCATQTYKQEHISDNLKY
jgi:hypothetical protein